MADKEQIKEEMFKFLKDLEFVQCLSNPAYLQYLSTNNYFKDPSFIRYLKYLLYFKQPEYFKYITYGRSLIFLELLQQDFFRKELQNPNFIDFLQTEIYESWVNNQTIS